MRPTDQANRHALLLLAVGGVIGVLLGVIAALHDAYIPTVEALPDDAIALVNGKPIREEEYVSAVALLAGDKRSALTDEDRAHVLTRLVEEELLVQQGIAGGLVDVDRAVRKTITMAMLDAIMAESASEQPTEEELHAFYQQHHPRFHDASDAPSVADAAVGTDFEEVREQVETAYIQQRRDEALREYLGWLRAEAKIVIAPEAHR